LAEYFDVDPSPVRVLVVVLTLILWFVPVVYIVLAIWMPKPEEDDS